MITKTVKRINMMILARVERNKEIGSTDTETLILINLREEIDILFMKSLYCFLLITDIL